VMLAAAGVLGWAGMRVVSRAGAMTPEAMSATAFAAAPVGAHVAVMGLVEVVGNNRTTTLQILNRTASGAYLRSGARLSFVISERTRFVMGSPPDLRPGAIVELSGPMSGIGPMTPDRVVILTGFVRLQ
jgi:hypothetical protein